MFTLEGTWLFIINVISLGSIEELILNMYVAWVCGMVPLAVSAAGEAATGELPLAVCLMGD